MGFAEREIERVAWGRLAELTGTAEAVGPALRQLLSASSPVEAERAYWKLENHIVVQGGVFEAAEPSVSVLVAELADERPRYVRIAVLELLYQIVSGGPEASELRRGHADLLTRCRARAREGLWLLARELVAGERDAALDVLELIDPTGSRGSKPTPFGDPHPKPR